MSIFTQEQPDEFACEIQLIHLENAIADRDGPGWDTHPCERKQAIAHPPNNTTQYTQETAKDIYKNEMSALKGKTVKNIRQYLGLLADKGLGEIDEMEGDKHKADSAVGFRAH